MTAFVSLSPVPGHRTFGNGSASAFHRARPSTVLRYGDDALCVPLQMGLVTGAREGSNRTTDDGHRARCVRLRRLSPSLSFVGPPTFPLFHFFFFFFFFFWFLAGECGCVPAHTAHAHAQTRPSCDGTDSVREGSRAPGYLLAWLGGGGGRPAPEDSARTTVCLGSLGGCRGTVRRESRVESPAHSRSHQPQSGHPTRADLVHMYDAQDMKKKRSRTSVSGAQAQTR